MIHHVVVAGMVYEVNTDTQLETFGALDHAKCSIRLMGGLSVQQEEETVLHEVLHAIDEACVLKLSEDTIRRLSRAIYAFIRDNQEFVKGML